MPLFSKVESIFLEGVAQIDIKTQAMGEGAPVQVEGDGTESGVVSILQSYAPVALEHAVAVGKGEEGGQSLGGIEIVGHEGDIVFLCDVHSAVGTQYNGGIANDLGCVDADEGHLVIHVACFEITARHVAVGKIVGVALDPSSVDLWRDSKLPVGGGEIGHQRTACIEEVGLSTVGTVVYMPLCGTVNAVAMGGKGFTVDRVNADGPEG